MNTLVQYTLGKRSTLGLLLVINFLGTIYGYYWYRDQLKATPFPLSIFVPDSPTASLFFCLVLVAFLFKRNWPLMEALAVTSLFKYGVWAVGMNLAAGAIGYPLQLGNWMLVVSHGSMAIEGLLYIPFYKIRSWHLVMAAIVLINNEMIDYVFHVMPWYPPLEPYEPYIGYITFWLSLFTIGLVYFTCVKPRFPKRY
ncbi:DUF1405 domain-containing protein [Pullulanibacillus sp. KACC 23026]|uniref:DUF1405 domain-containing protein n=1 Tax=Pullulanibacillus sp. KACC 23026 TaxID=3028315 RepID=UPI0023AFF700|nr:DUF1405 domain-containing protein [Pullulanibacillus sp. KACC 23026]WEG11345.1 DUF1405 domain-containing protein [Pullulanibacillus sp. KACC 23026]